MNRDNIIRNISIGAVVFVVMTWLLTYLLLKDDGFEDRGTFGDMFGAVNALFSGLAFIGIIITILLQSNELTLQSKELIHTRNELKRTAEAQERSENALKRQAENLKISAQLSALNTLVVFPDFDSRTKLGMSWNEEMEKI